MYGIWPRSGEIDLLESREFFLGGGDFHSNSVKQCVSINTEAEIVIWSIEYLGGNRNLTNHIGEQIGVERFGSTLHFGPNWDQNGYSTATFSKRSPPGHGFNMDFHRYQLIWTPERLRFCIDSREVGVVEVGEGFWARYPFQGENPWINGSKAAPFDQQVSIEFLSNFWKRTEIRVL